MPSTLVRKLRQRSEEAQQVARQWKEGSRAWVAADARAAAFAEAAAIAQREASSGAQPRQESS